MQRKNTNRMDRVNEEFKRELGKIIDQDLKNPNITGLISVTKVKTSPDLKTAKVYISIINSKSKKNTMQGLKNATGLYFKVLDSDDCLGRKALQKVLDLLEDMVAKDG